VVNRALHPLVGRYAHVADQQHDAERARFCIGASLIARSRLR
jgi:hypothetical protein